MHHADIPIRRLHKELSLIHILKTEEGRDYHGSFLIGNEAGISMKGILYSECSYIKFESEQFTGTEVCVKYVFSPGKLTAGEKRCV